MKPNRWSISICIYVQCISQYKRVKYAFFAKCYLRVNRAFYTRLSHKGIVQTDKKNGKIMQKHKVTSNKYVYKPTIFK